MRYEQMRARIGNAARDKGEHLLEKAMGLPIAPLAYTLIDEAHEGLVRVVDKLEPAISAGEQKIDRVHKAWENIRSGNASEIVLFQRRKVEKTLINQENK